jgi:lipoprotein-releasing system permease protein
MFSAFERMMAFRYLRARRKEGFVSVIAGFSFVGIALGVGTLIVVMAVMNGFRHDITDRILGMNGHIDVVAIDRPLGDYESLSTKLRGVSGVTSATPLIQGQAMASGNNRTDGVLVRGVSGDDIKGIAPIAKNVLEGSLDRYAAGEGIAIGSRLAERFKLREGGQLTLIAANGQVTAFGTAPRVQTFTVAAIFNVGMTEFDSSVVFMPLPLAQVYFRYPAAVTNFEVHVANPDDARAIAGQISEIVGPGNRVLSWEQTNAALFNALQVERNVMFLILTLIILVAAFNIISGLIMLVKDKSSDIAILRTMGAARGSIMRIFFMAGASIGAVGTTLGFLLGVLICENIENIRQFMSRLTGTDLFSPEVYFLSQLPAKMEWTETGSIFAMSLGLSFLATLYPSWRAAKTDPVEALRYE